MQDGIGDINTVNGIGAGLSDSCASCHGRPRGSAGGGGDVVTRPDSRDAPHLFGLGLEGDAGGRDDGSTSPDPGGRRPCGPAERPLGHTAARRQGHRLRIDHRGSQRRPRHLGRSGSGCGPSRAPVFRAGRDDFDSRVRRGRLSRRNGPRRGRSGPVRGQRRGPRDDSRRNGPRRPAGPRRSAAGRQPRPRSRRKRLRQRSADGPGGLHGVLPAELLQAGHLQADADDAPGPSDVQRDRVRVLPRSRSPDRPRPPCGGRRDRLRRGTGNPEQPLCDCGPALRRDRGRQRLSGCQESRGAGRSWSGISSRTSSATTWAPISTSATGTARCRRSS